MTAVESSEVLVSVFASDTHRRVCGNLAQPRSAPELASFLRSIDPFVDQKAYTPDGVGDFLRDLEADGLVKRIGTHETPEAILDAVQDDEQTIDLHEEKAEALLARAANPRRTPHLGEELWVQTRAGLERLTAPAPNEPPALEGEALAARERANEEMAAADLERAAASDSEGEGG